MAHVVILGAGAMGTAFAYPVAENGHQVSLVGTHLDIEWVSEMHTRSIHPKLGLKLPDNVEAFHYHGLEVALRNTPDILVFGVSSPGIPWAINQVAPLLEQPVPIILLTKGLTVIAGTLDILPSAVRDGLAQAGLKDNPVGAIGGPCIAAELAAHRDSSVLLATTQASVTDSIQRLISTPYYHVRKTTDLIGLELCAALKNFFTLAIGSAQGKLEKEGRAENGAAMFNLSSGLFSQALQEMAYLVTVFGGSAETVRGLAGAGDLLVTCMAGRNSRMGALLGQGISFSTAKAIHMPKETVEGSDLAHVIASPLKSMIKKQLLDHAALPMTLAIIEAVCNDLPLTIPWQRFYR